MSEWMAAMRRGDLPAAWRISDAVLRARQDSRTQCWTWPRHEQFLWNGACPSGRRVLVHCYHGLGDTLQFVRFLAPLRARAAHVTLWAQPELIELLRPVAGIDALLPLHDGSPGGDYEVDLEIMELPHALRVSVGELAPPGPYLSVPGASTLPRPAAAHRLRVGLAWRAGGFDPARSVPEELLAPLERLPVDWFSLQYPPLRAPLPAVQLAVETVEGTAAAMAGLDLILTVDTMIAHLAGAMGRPVWMMLRHEADWRWFDDPERTVWYPTMRLFRQPAPGAWQPVLATVSAALNAAGAGPCAHATHPTSLATPP